MLSAIQSWVGLGGHELALHQVRRRLDLRIPLGGAERAAAVAARESGQPHQPQQPRHPLAPAAQAAYLVTSLVTSQLVLQPTSLARYEV